MPSSSRSRVVIGLLLALLVQGAWLLLLQMQRGPGAAAGPKLLELRLFAPPLRKALRPEKPAPRSPSADRRVPPPLVPAPPMQATAAPAVDTPLQPRAAVVTAPAPLNLALPPAERSASGPRRESMQDQIRNDPRVRTARRTFEDRIADGAGTLPVTMAPATDGTHSTIVRQGSKCTRVAEARIKTLQPMDPYAQGVPSISGPCFQDR